MSNEKKSNIFSVCFERLFNGIIKENPTFVMMLGMCPTLAVTTSCINGIGMGLTTTVVLALSNVFISMLRKIIPNKARVPAFIVVVASFVTMVQFLLEAYLPSLNASLGIYIPLIVVNCIILGRAEAFASKNTVLYSAVDGVGMGVGFTAALLLMGGIRELLGAGSIAGFTVFPEAIPPMTIFVLAPGGFFVFGILIALANKVAERNGKPKAELKGCSACPMASTCSLVGSKEACKEETK